MTSPSSSTSSSLSTCCTSATKSKKSMTVSFHRSVYVRTTLHINNYSNAEYEACWYTPQEERDRKRQLRHNSLSMIAEESRGLEKKLATADLQEKNYQQKRQSIQAVVTEQYRQEQEIIIMGDNNNDKEERLAAVYSQYTMESKMAAYLLGISDQRIARIIHSETNKPPSQNGLLSLFDDGHHCRLQIFSMAA